MTPTARRCIGQIGAALAFLLVGAGLHTTQTAGLALATDLAPEEARPRVVALLYVMLLVGMVASALVFGLLLANFSEMRLIQVIQGAALLTMVLNIVALWKQEARRPSHRVERAAGAELPGLLADVPCGRTVAARPGCGRSRHRRRSACKTSCSNPMAAKFCKLSVGETTSLTAMLAAGTLVGLALAARWLGAGVDPYRLAALGVLAGIVAFSAVIFAAPFDFSGVVSHWRGADRLRRRAFRGRHPDCGDGTGARRPKRSRARRMGRRASLRGRLGDRIRRCCVAMSSPTSPATERSGRHSPTLRPAMASSTTLRSCCCSSLWLPSGHWCDRGRH